MKDKRKIDRNRIPADGYQIVDRFDAYELLSEEYRITLSEKERKVVGFIEKNLDGILKTHGLGKSFFVQREYRMYTDNSEVRCDLMVGNMKGETILIEVKTSDKGVDFYRQAKGIVQVARYGMLYKNNTGKDASLMMIDTQIHPEIYLFVQEHFPMIHLGEIGKDWYNAFLKRERGCLI